ncbi:hypothetical protein SM124_13180 [Bacillus sp. 31A1R]|uniref:DUF7662 domain-containing protein n=1 Tax=Robertmurraya mangrovi TaxID=3098077 RepID=A0ABU5IZU1_9BACI|nr:hypothetical protein [Bacillus sp. 31A1R]MDZ5472685.1 hypothetical protein [Bacillus sp. 31A1R]
MTKYEPLSHYLKQVKPDRITLSYSEIESILSDTLPSSALKYKAWWSNEKTNGHVQSKAWMEAGWMVTYIRLGESIDFQRDTVPHQKNIRDQTGDKNHMFSHGEGSTKKRTRLYVIWMGMRQRCFNVNAKDYKNYGARGITVCPEWSQYTVFKEWALANGYEEHLTLDREDVNGSYCPENCRWTTVKNQGNNTRVNHKVTIQGETKTISEWAALTGIGPKTLRHRIVSGWKEEDLLLPTGVQKVYITIDGVTQTITEWAKESRLSASVISKRYKEGGRGKDLFGVRQKRLVATINGETKTLKDWAKETGLNYRVIHARFQKGIRGELLISPSRTRTQISRRTEKKT